MTISLKAPEDEVCKPKITIVGVGGAGINAIANMIRSELKEVEYVVANTDAQVLKNCGHAKKIQLGLSVTQGLGAGADREVGEAAAIESTDDIKEALKGSNMVFVTAGMGGGTGTGASPIIAKIAKELGILTVGVVTKPFDFEGSQRMKTANRGLQELQQFVDTLIVIPNQNLFRIANEQTTFADAFKKADDVLRQGVSSITDLITVPGLINLDFADIKFVMSKMGKAMMGTGEASGEDRALKAAEAAMSNPLLEHSKIRGAKGVLINITGGSDMTLFEVDAAANRIRDEAGDEANIIFGSAFDPELSGVIRVSVVATGIDAEEILAHIKPQNIAEYITEEIEEDPLVVEEEVPVFEVATGQEEQIPDHAEDIIQSEASFVGVKSMDLRDKQDLSSIHNQKISIFSKMWNSLKSPDKLPQVPSSAQDYTQSQPQQDNKIETDIQDIPSFLRKQK
jgi:cell division protein FtsZ